MLIMDALPQRNFRARLKGIVAAALFPVLSCLGLFAFTMPSHATEEPDFNIIRELEKDIELRQYAAYLVAEVEVPGPASEALLDQASATLGGAGRPQVVLVVTARFQRLSWKYRSMVYALVLKHVGVLYQTLYLVATDMGLAPCAMGGGDSDLFAEASGLDPLIEASVGEFALGSREVELDVD